MKGKITLIVGQPGQWPRVKCGWRQASDDRWLVSGRSWGQGCVTWVEMTLGFALKNVGNHRKALNKTLAFILSKDSGHWITEQRRERHNQCAASFMSIGHKLESSTGEIPNWKKMPPSDCLVGKSVVHFISYCWCRRAHLIMGNISSGQVVLGCIESRLRKSEEQATKEHSSMVSTSFFASRFLTWVLSVTSLSDGDWEL